MADMEYVFGTDEEDEVLKTKSEDPDVLGGFVEILREYPDQNILDRFHIKEHKRSIHFDKHYYNWYVIDEHYRSLDKTPPATKAIQEGNDRMSVIEDALCELDANDVRMDTIEDALCELDINSEGAM